ncbi:TetR/AcrR family transcriptional regulator [Streptomyces sp. CA-111067]|uniref:TetR/AcrR family transcriptional regulator n=1 Tax=Streptomyces sp. CA-111067 TaxID=3240046 RepID=UPI003D99E361
MPAEPPRAPQQQRSREKVARILAAASGLLETTPYDELGTKLIAAEAGVSVGVLYRYFADKEAIVSELVRRWFELDVRVAEQHTEGPLPGSSRELFDRLVEAYAVRFRAEPGYRQIWYQGPRIAALNEDAAATDRLIAEKVHAALVRGYGLPDTELTRRRARLAVSVGTHLLDLAFRDRPDGDPDILADAALIMDRYLLAPPD